MATSLDLILVPKVYSLIDELGRSVSFSSVTSSAYDPTTGVTSQATSAKTAKATPPAPYNIMYVDGDIIESGDMETLIAAQGLTWTPVVGMAMTWASGNVWRVVSVKPIYSGESVCAYSLQLRR